MVMVYQRPPGELTPHGKQLLKVLQDAVPNWLSRSDIAKILGKARLTPYEIGVLESLCSMGIAECQQAPKAGFIPFEWQYRAKTDG